MIGKTARAGLLALFAASASLDGAAARSAYDGTWSLTFTTERGSCSTYHFAVDITNGMVTHPNLVRFRGRVSSNGRVRASVTAGSRHASGSGRLTGSSGRGRWAGHSGGDRCSGSWTAQRY
jgi:hypothetical protein